MTKKNKSDKDKTAKGMEILQNVLDDANAAGSGKDSSEDIARHAAGTVGDENLSSGIDDNRKKYEDAVASSDEAEKSEEDIRHTKDTEYRLALNKFLSVAAELNISPDACIGALFAAAGNIAHNTIKDTEVLRNHLGHMFAQVVAAIEIERNPKLIEELKQDDAGSKGEESD